MGVRSRRRFGSPDRPPGTATESTARFRVLPGARPLRERYSRPTTYSVARPNDRGTQRVGSGSDSRGERGLLSGLRIRAPAERRPAGTAQRLPLAPPAARPDEGAALAGRHRPDG